MISHDTRIQEHVRSRQKSQFGRSKSSQIALNGSAPPPSRPPSAASHWVTGADYEAGAESIGATRSSLYSATLEFSSRPKEQAWVLAKGTTGVIRMGRAGSKIMEDHPKQFPSWKETIRMPCLRAGERS